MYIASAGSSKLHLGMAGGLYMQMKGHCFLAPPAAVLPQVAAVLKRCAAQTAAGRPRCSELDRYMANCIKVTP
jgi:hypothetical protein